MIKTLENLKTEKMVLDSIYNADCNEALKYIPDNSIDLILTDPPFNVGLEYDSIDDRLTNEEYYSWSKIWMVELHRILKERHYCIIFTGDINCFYIFKAIMESGLSFHHFLKWHKPTAQTPLKGTVFFCRTELAFLCSKGKPDISLINRKVMYQDTITCKHTRSNDKDSVDHNARRPIGLYRLIIEGFTKEGDSVLDPFIGSGTTSLACQESRRHFVGIEISLKYCEIIKERLKQQLLNI